MNRVFYIFRHGETEWNRERRCQGHTNIPLNETGFQQAAILAQRLHKFPIEVIFSSDLDRALHTGKIVAEKKGIPLLLDVRLRETHYGEIEGMIYEDAVLKYGEEIWEKLKCFRAENDHACFPGGETRDQTRKRFFASLFELMEKHPYQHIGVSTHGGALRAIIHSFLPEDHPMIAIPNCVVYKLSYDVHSKSFSADTLPL